MTTGYFDLGDGSLYFEDINRTGNPDAPVVVLNHAAFLDSRMWDAQIDAFARRFRMIRHDMLGFGRSSIALGPRQRRADLSRLLDHLGVGRAHMIGASMGGEIALDLAIEQPQRIASLLLINSVPSGFQPQGAPPRYLFEMIEASQRGDIERASELNMRIWFDGPFREPGQVDAGLRSRAMQMNQICARQNTFFIADIQPAAPLTPPALQRLATVVCPVLIMTSTLDDPELLRAGAIMAAGIPGARVQHIADAAHVPSFEVPAVFNPIALAFLESVM